MKGIKIVQVKMSEEVSEKIKKASARVGLAPSSFLRFLALKFIDEKWGGNSQ